MKVAHVNLSFKVPDNFRGAGDCKNCPLHGESYCKLDVSPTRCPIDVEVIIDE